MPAPAIDSAVVPTLARFSARIQKDGPAAAMQWLERSNCARAVAIVKSPVPPMPHADVSGDIRAATIAWVEFSRTRGVLFRLVADRAVRLVPFRCRVNLAVSSASAAVAGEGEPVPISLVTLLDGTLVPMVAAAIVVTSDEAWSDMSSAGQSFLNGELKGAIADEVDRAFFDALMDSSTPQVVSVGQSAVDAKADLRALLALVNLTASRVYLVCSPDVALAASTLATADGADAFPGMGIDGGEMAGLPVLVSSIVPAGTIFAIDAQSLAANVESIVISTSTEADLEMLDAPTQNAPGTGASMVNLWQNNLIAVRATVTFGAELLKVNAISILSDIAWGEIPPS